MRRNKQVVEEFLQRKKAHSNRGMSLWYVSNIIFTYAEPLAYRVADNFIIINKKRYSRTSTRHRTLLEGVCLSKEGMRMVYVSKNILEECQHKDISSYSQFVGMHL